MDKQLLFQQAAHILEKDNMHKKQTGNNFNIFRITNIFDDEVKICRVLHDLLNPDGNHFQGPLFLKAFIERVLTPDVIFTAEDYTNVKVFREYYLSSGRRIDLYIRTPNIKIPIEVKIHAEDQTSQCVDYAEHAVNSKIIYLTKYGSKPSDKSLGKLNIQGVYCISFQKDILQWLQYCAALPELSAPVQEILLQLIDAIKQFTNQLGDDVMHDIESLVSASKEHMKSALLIQEGITQSKIQLMTKLFRAIERKINFSGSAFPRYEEEVKAYYQKRNHIIPKIEYVYKENAIEGHHIILSIEIDHRLYAKFYVQDEALPLTDDLVRIHMPHMVKICAQNPSYTWHYLPLFVGNNPTINFYKANLKDDYIQLFDDVYFDQFVEECVTDIKTLLEEV